MGEIQAKLVRKIESGKAWYFDKYEFECIDCGRHYRNGRFDSRTVPYCNDCKRKHDKERAEKLKEKRRKAYEKDIRDNAIDDFSRMMKDANLTNAFVLYQADEIDLSEFIDLASDEIANRLKGVTL